MAALPASGVSSVLSHRIGAVAHLCLNDPQSRNALSDAMIGQLRTALQDIAQETMVKVVVISARGPVFCSGHNLKEIEAHRSGADKGRAAYAALFDACSALMQQIIALPQPVIAAVERTATAAGCQLVASCDLAIAGMAAQFCTPGVNIGLFCSTPMVALSRAVAPKHALHMLLTGEMISAMRAQEIGLVNAVVPEGHALDEALVLANRISHASGLTLRTGKAAFYAQQALQTAEAYTFASRVMVDNLLTHDAEEGITAFLTKRQPLWEDR